MAIKQIKSVPNKSGEQDDILVALEHYWRQQRVTSQNLTAKIHSILPLFVGKPYQWEALGEGDDGPYSQDPLYRFDAFDCVTFVNTILALIYSDSMTAFEKNMQNIRYATGKVDYTQRTDWFTDLEWNPRAQQLGWIQDVTPTLKDVNQQPLFRVAETVIDKPGWYAARSLEDLHLHAPLSIAEKAARLAALQAEGQAFSPKKSQLPYIPLGSYFDASQQPITSFWAQMPVISVVEIVRPDWPIKMTWVDPQGRVRGYGTNLNISHLGFVIKDPETEKFCFYHASCLETKAVVALDLFDYLRLYCHHDTIKGIHIEVLQESLP
jgi:hypothetical protein